MAAKYNCVITFFYSIMYIFISREDFSLNLQNQNNQNFIGFTNSNEQFFEQKEYLRLNFDVTSFARNQGFNEAIFTLQGVFSDSVIKFLLSGQLVVTVIKYINQTSSIVYRYKNSILLSNTINNGENIVKIASKLIYNDNITEYISKTCKANFCDAKCGLNIQNYTKVGSVTQLISNYSFIDTSRNEPDNTFYFGSLTFTSGKNQGITYPVKGVSGNVIYLLSLLKYQLNIGDSYTIQQSCQKTYQACKNYNNQLNFRGF